jgi:hypothetical protein
MKLLNTERPVTRNFVRHILLNVQDFHKVGYTSYDEGIFGPNTDFNKPREDLQRLILSTQWQWL